MKTILISFFCLITTVVFGQSKDDTTYLKQQAKVYLTKMYITKQYDSAAEMWDKRMFLEMEDFYNKRKQGHLTDTVLYNRIKADVKKYYKQLKRFSIDKFLGTTVEMDNGYKMGYVFYQFTQTLNGKFKSDKAMLIFISEDEGKTWVIQDWTVKWVADQVNKKLF
jgi:hypothetical protein